MTEGIEKLEPHIFLSLHFPVIS